VLIIREQLKQQQAAIEAWFQAQWANISPPFYTSVDLRDNGIKLAPVDVNLFPAGFNNLTPEDQADAAQQVAHLLQQLNISGKRVLIITENHTRNPYYLEHLACLKTLLSKAGYTVKLSMLAPIQQTVTTLSEQTLHLEIVSKNNNYLHIHGFIPDWILLNNDLSEGYPLLLSKLNQPIIPVPELGWHQRKKSHYFRQYANITKKFAHALGWDDWLINPLFASCDSVDLTQPSEQAQLIEIASRLFDQIAEKYRLYHYDQKPYLMVKTDSGSYGMGIIKIDHPEDIGHLSRKQRQHMAKTKGNRPIQSVILQEGIATITQYNQTVAEPVIYLIGSEVIGGFYRTHPQRNAQSNLNAPGMEFVPMSFERTRCQPNQNIDTLLYAYQVIARLATLAASYEAKEAEPSLNT
jgi:glutamate--cysteine ligase